MSTTSASHIHKCLHCGNNQISHIHARLGSAMSGVMDPLSRSFLTTYIGRVLFSFTDLIITGLLHFFCFVGIANFDANHEHILGDRGKVLAEEARRRGWKMEMLCVLGNCTDTYRLTTPQGQVLVFKGVPRLGVHTDITSGWIDDKALLKQCLMAEHVPVSVGQSFTRLSDAERYFHTAKKPLIVKPRFGSRGRHTTTHVYSLADFKHAFRVAKQIGNSIIVEEHLIGSVYRATMIDGVLEGVLAGDPPRITGDGTHTIQELMEIKNKNRHERVGAVTVTDRMSNFLSRQNYTVESILPSGATIDLSEKIGLSYGGSAREVTRETHPKLRSELERAARILRDPLLGFDFISTDITQDPDTVRWGIIECNTIPFINLHHDPLEGEPVNIAGKVFDYLERNMV